MTMPVAGNAVVANFLMRFPVLIPVAAVVGIATVVNLPKEEPTPPVVVVQQVEAPLPPPVLVEKAVPVAVPASEPPVATAPVLPPKKKRRG
jgi:hypothetical protein